MTSYSYISLASADGTISKKFRVMEGGYQITLSKRQTENETLGGLDVSIGSVAESYEYIIKVRHGRTIGALQVEPDDFGIIDDLKSLYLLNNPQGASNNKLTLSDHYGNTHAVLFLGDFVEKPVCVLIEGGAAMFYIPVRFRSLTWTGGFSNKHVYLQGSADFSTSSTDAYTAGVSGSPINNKHGYTRGMLTSLDNQSAFLYGNLASIIHSYLEGSAP